ncbi:MAG: hypothetical protein K2X82_19825 [Gemmataceae bacterium]|nr:hypothetical protein [Gemmataceae bacterium]
MWTRVVLGVAVVSAAAATGGQKDERTKACLPPLPDGNACLFRVAKVGRGEIGLKLGREYECRDQQPATARGAAGGKVELRTAARPCDEDPKLIPDGSILRIEPAGGPPGEVIRRADDLAHLTSPFRIEFRGTTLFAGHLEATHRLSTCHKPFGADDCDQKNRLHGWLVGAGEGPAAGFTLRAYLTATTDPLKGPQVVYRLTEFALDGVLVKAP